MKVDDHLFFLKATFRRFKTVIISGFAASVQKIVRNLFGLTNYTIVILFRIIRRLAKKRIVLRFKKLNTILNFRVKRRKMSKGLFFLTKGFNP